MRVGIQLRMVLYQEKELNKVDGDFQTQDGTKVEWLKEESYFFKLSN